MTILNEDSRSQLLNRSKTGDNYAAGNRGKGKNRYFRRLHSTVANSVKEFNSIDMNKLFKDDILDVNIKVKGETDNYVVTLKLTGVISNIQQELKNQPQFNFRTIARALIKSFNAEDVYIHCSCPDFKYRFNFWALKHSINSWDDVFNTEGRIVDRSPGQWDNSLASTQAPIYDRTNKSDTAGAACKHCLMVLSNNNWFMKVGSVIQNYIKYTEKYYPDLYKKIIFPALYEKEWKEMSEYEIQQDLADTEVPDENGETTTMADVEGGKEIPPEDELPSDEETINIANKWNATKQQYRTGKQNKDYENEFKINNKKTIDYDNLMSD